MSYKPKFCCQCREKIDGVDRKFWSSGRFCELCATEFGIYDKLRWVLVGISFVFGLYGIGSYFQKPAAQLNVAPNQFAVSNVKDNPVQPKGATQVPTGGGVQSSAQTDKSATQAKLPSNSTATNLKNSLPTAAPPEKVFFCGAQTKKGTMCSRRVKNGGRCWQHEGMAAMLPPEKLLAAQ